MTIFRGDRRRAAPNFIHPSMMKEEQIRDSKARAGQGAVKASLVAFFTFTIGRHYPSGAMAHQVVEDSLIGAALVTARDRLGKWMAYREALREARRD